MGHRSGAANDDEPYDLTCDLFHARFPNLRQNNSMTSPKHLIVCADDFGMNAGIDTGILDLARMGRLSAVSCMSQGHLETPVAEELSRLPVDLGLHLNFTDSMDGSAFHVHLPLLIATCYARAFPWAVIERGIHAQLDAFETAFGRIPDYVDGHQHVHQLPGIRDCLIPLLRRRYAGRSVWLRSTRSPASATLPFRRKANLIDHLGCRQLLHLATEASIPFNHCLLGVYDFTNRGGSYENLLSAWIAAASDGDLLMCHPAATVGSGNDPIAAQRVCEKNVLSGPVLPQLLAREGFSLTRLSLSEK